MRFSHNLLFIIFFIAALMSACQNTEKSAENHVPFASYINIPGVTDEEIEAIENLKKNTKEFIYGMLPNTETFLNSQGELSGYTVLLCEWLTELFGITFVPKHYAWFEILEGLESGDISFTGELTANDERRKTYFMTGTMAQRSLKYFRLEGSKSFAEISRTRLPRYIIQEKTTIAGDVAFYAGGTYEPVFVQEYDEAYELLRSQAADALITESVQEAFWDTYGDIAASDFFPLIYSPVSLSTRNPNLSVIISVFQKALDNGALNYLGELYETGQREYMKHKLFTRLSKEEIEYIKQNPVINLGAEYDYYPASYYSERYGQWQGIAHDVLNEISSLTGLEFKVVHGNSVQFYELLEMLESGKADMLTEVIRTPEREGLFLWPSNSVMTERSVLISRVNYRNITLNRIYSEKIGICKGTAHAEFFYSWFPNHPNITEYESQVDSFNALTKGEVDLVMNSYSSLLNLTNYQELPDYKVNIMFNNSFASTFGFNKNKYLLCSIVDKALGMVDTETIAEQWRHRTYDYRLKVEQARTPWLIGSIILSLLVLSLVANFFLRSRQAGKELERLVQKRTYELAFQTAALSTLFDSIPDLIFTKNLEFKFLHCNKAFLEHFNMEIDDVVGNADGAAMGMTDEEAYAYNEMDRKVITEVKTVTLEEHIPHHSGTKPLYETIKMPLILENKVVGIMGIARNITKRKETEEAALAASQSKSAFLANMSHEIRTPMNAILGVTELLIQHEKLPDDIEEGLDKIYSSCDLLLGIINDILDFSKIEAGKLDIVPSQYKVASMINDSVHLNMMRIESKPIIFELQIKENIPAKLTGDELRIKQIINNLLSNAFKYTDTGRVTLTVEAERAPDAAEDKKIILILSVRDTGHGMTKEQLSRMFEEYSRFSQGNKRTVEGTGLGLAITQRLLQLMNGKIHVESEPGKGSLFTVRLPQEIIDDEILSKDVIENLQQFRRNYMKYKKRSQITRDPMPYGSVLIVDDVETNIYVAAGLMNLYKLQIDIAMNGRDAIEKIKSGKIYDVIFMDHMMPEMDGLEAANKIRSLGYSDPIVALTANAVSGQADMFLENGFNDFISKPIDIRQLNSVLNKYIRDKQTPEVIEEARKSAEKNEEAQERNENPLIDSFLRDAGKAVFFLDEILKNNDLDKQITLQRFIITVHGIKSSLWNIGESEIAGIAYDLEKEGRKNNINFLKQITPDFINKLRSLLEKLSLERRQSKTINAGENTEVLCGIFKEIQQFADDYNRKDALEKIKEIKNCTKETKAVLDIITEHVLHSEFEEAKKIALDYESKLRKI